MQKPASIETSSKGMCQISQIFLESLPISPKGTRLSCSECLNLAPFWAWQAFLIQTQCSARLVPGLGLHRFQACQSVAVQESGYGNAPRVTFGLDNTELRSQQNLECGDSSPHWFFGIAFSSRARNAPPPGLPRWFNGFCTTISNVSAPTSSPLSFFWHSLFAPRRP